VLVDQRLAERDDILRLGVEQADGLDRLAERFLAEINHLAWCLDTFEQGLRGDVHAGIRGLRRQHDGDEQLVGVGRLKLGRGRRVRLSQPSEEFENLVALHKASITSRIE